jgi:HEAT repeat protein
LTDEAIRVVFFAAEALGKLGDRRAVKPLIEARGDRRHAQIRQNAAEALGPLADLRALDPLILALDDRDREVRMKAALALRALGDPKTARREGLDVERAVYPLPAREPESGTSTETSAPPSTFFTSRRPPMFRSMIWRDM